MTDAARTPDPILSWKQLLQLGEGLISKTSLIEQSNFLKQNLEAIFQCRVLPYLADQPTENDAPSKLIGFALRHQAAAVCQGSARPKLIPKKPSKQKSAAPAFNNLAVPIKFQSEILGAIHFSHDEGAFSSAELDLIDGLSSQVAFALKIWRQKNVNQKQFDSLSLFHAVNAHLAADQRLEDLANTVARLILESFRVGSVAIYSCRESQENLILLGSAAAASTNGSVDSPLPATIQTGAGSAGRAAQEGVEIKTTVPSASPTAARKKSPLHIGHEIALPLKSNNKIIGVLLMRAERQIGADEFELVALRSLAGYIGAVIDNMRLDQDVKLKIEQLASVSEVSNAITSILDETQLLNQVVDLIFRRLGYPFVQVFTVHTGRRKVFYRAGKSSFKKDIHEDGFAYELDNPSGIIPYVARVGKAYLSNDLTTDQLFLPPDPKLIVSKSEITIPLIFADQTIGILDVQSDRLNAFSESDQFLLEAIADHIAVAMHNAALYRSEQWRSKVAESMSEVAGLLTANADSDQLLQHILHELERTLPIDVAAVWLLESRQASQDEQKPTLQLAAVHLSEEFTASNEDNENHFNADEILQYCCESGVPSLWLHEALERPEPLIRCDEDPYEPLGAILDFDAAYSAIAAPLRIGNEVIGLLSLAHHTSGRYGHESQNMTATFASYAAVAIENTRLYETAHDQAWISTILLQVAEATQSLNSLEDLLSTMAQITPTLIGMNSCSIFLWDSFREIFVPSKSFGLNEEQEALFQTWWISLGDVPAVDQLYFSKAPVYAVKEELPEEHPLSAAIQAALNFPIHNLVLFPMVTRGDVLGFFLITYPSTQELNQSSGKLSPEIDWEEKYAIIQGITQQTAVAVENLQLIKAQQEEAYVSVALLQVAQAVVSFKALTEILETIVRLTPILIGVRRCAIFLWNEAEHCYHLTDSYGLARSDMEEMGSDFLECEFPLLDSIRTRKMVAVHDVTPQTEGPLSWQFIQEDQNMFVSLESSSSFEDNKFTLAFQPNLDREFLHRVGSLMFGFPLLVKGNIVGVMLTQEMEPSTTNFQGRAKRYEISIGITQQVAMAIQNDRLQHEALERERLEREFQLAREIQQTFLPDHLPIFSEWDLEALWQPARQVSGDFYDVIELPGKKLGIVIADVADKGMPAALFMTLIRTLIRAAAQELESPAEVLHRVNDLLIPDTKHGMFVTVAYFVIDLHTGEIRYANAGHNPPLIFRAQGQQHLALTRTGIALGIFEDIEMSERSDVLEKGDTLVLYTDGITESFSPEEEMFGDKKLIEVISNKVNAPLNEILEHILATVTEFIGGANYSDDITMVSVRRK